MKNKHVVLLCDHKWRDLPGLVLLKLTIQNFSSKINVSIIPRDDIFDFLSANSVDQVVLASSNTPWLENTKILHEKGIQVLLLPTEGRPNYGKMLSWSVTRHNGDSVDGTMLWSKTMEKVLMSVPDKVALDWTVTGPVRFDFYSDKLNDIFLSKKDLYKALDFSENLPLVTISSVFPHAKHYGSEKWQINDWKNMGFDKIGLSNEENLKFRIKSEFDNRQKLFETVKDLSYQFPNIGFVIKCHPFEDVVWWENNIQNLNLKNFKFIKGIYIGDLLKWTKLHLHRSCTTGTEAWIFNKPTAELDFLDDYFLTMMNSAEINGAVEDAYLADERVGNSSDLKNMIQKYVIDNKEVSKEYLQARKQYLEKWFYKLDGNACVRASDFILAKLYDSKYEGWAPEKKKIKDSVKDFIKSFLINRKDKITEKTAAIWDKKIQKNDVKKWEKIILKLIKKKGQS